MLDSLKAYNLKEFLFLSEQQMYPPNSSWVCPQILTGQTFS